jgi:hypothetical protein
LNSLWCGGWEGRQEMSTLGREASKSVMRDP